ncbi:thioesterase [Streptomyces sp. HC44]|uniref:Thioesterase n=1 Tax=Streptomyces scabichelini TaxID=2711217 RepID=A0A6G4V1K3_9ACTN|nr:alpha/beta fold hydrolase [Streptomyces scabichelini]NGO07876.1 thioesterase [Streptomyces scabichelini]
MTVVLNTWLRTFWPRPDAALSMVFFPHAGGSAGFYRPLAQDLPEYVEPVIVQYPGRADRVQEPPCGHMDELADALAEALAPLAGKPVWLFGHSMGASVAHEVARRLAAQGGPRAQHVIVSGRPGPARQRPGDKHLDDDRLWSDVRGLGGTDSRLLALPEIRAMALPAIRADYRLIETYRPWLGTDLDVPVTACFSDGDPEVDREDMEAWRPVTTGPFAVERFRGGHFYLCNGSRSAVVDWLAGLTAKPSA